MSLLGSA